MSVQSRPLPVPAAVAWRRPLMAGVCATFVGIGLHRFAYAPLLPALIAGGWFSPAQASYLGAANLSGYLVGAISAPRLAGKFGARLMLRVTMALGAITFFACAAQLPFAWFFFWRTMSGICGGLAMVLAAPSIAAALPPERRALVASAVFGGVGLGIIASATIVPLLLRSGLSAAWSGLGLLALIAAGASWHSWPGDAPRHRRYVRPEGRPSWSKPLRTLCISYGLAAVSMVPGMIFLVDYVARNLGRGVESAAVDWAGYGIGAMIGPAALGALAHRIGAGTTFRLTLLFQGGVTFLIAMVTGGIAVPLLSTAAGAMMAGIVGLAATRARELGNEDLHAQRRAWSACTTALAIGQALSAYGYSYFLAGDVGRYPAVFAVAALPVVAALLIEIDGGTGDFGQGRPGERDNHDPADGRPSASEEAAKFVHFTRPL